MANNNSAVAAKSNTNNVPRISSKHPLKKSNTFPYEKLHHNDTTDSYSSENESMGCEKIQEENNVDSVADDQVNGQKETHNQNWNNAFVEHDTHVWKRWLLHQIYKLSDL